MAKHSAERIAQIRGHLADLESRGIRVAEFAREIGVSAWTIYSWKKRYGSKSESVSERTPALAEVAPTRADLVEIAAGPCTAVIEIDIAGMTLRVPPACSADDLRAVLTAVKSC